MAQGGRERAALRHPDYPRPRWYGPVIDYVIVPAAWAVVLVMAAVAPYLVPVA